MLTLKTWELFLFVEDLKQITHPFYIQGKAVHTMLLVFAIILRS